MAVYDRTASLLIDVFVGLMVVQDEPKHVGTLYRQ
jgi:hypothetical protein